MSELDGVFNKNRDYSDKKLVLGEEIGLYDTINRNLDLKDLFRQAVAQNWSPDEFDFSPCAKEFKRKDEAADIMLDVLAWQWEADSVVSHTLMPILAPFMTNCDLAGLMAFNTYIECVHSETYSEIVRNSFENPREVLEEIIQRQEAMERLTVTAKVLSELSEIGHKYSLGEVNKREVFPYLYKGVVALYLLERLQFIASFAVTFAMGEAGLYQPIANAVRKICSDEIQIHATADTMILRDLRTHEFWEEVNTLNFQKEVEELVDDTVAVEHEFSDFLFKDRSLVGLNSQLLKDWVTYNAQVVKQELLLPVDIKIKENPLLWIESWLTLNKLQGAAQEIETTQYLIGELSDDTDNVEFEF